MSGKEIRQIACDNCGKVFITTHHNRKYCSYECSNVAGNERAKKIKHIRICKNCGNTFSGTATAMFCSKECKAKYFSIMKQKRICSSCFYSVKIANGEPLCNYGEITGRSRTAIGKTGIPCRLYERRELCE